MTTDGTRTVASTLGQEAAKTGAITLSKDLVTSVIDGPAVAAKYNCVITSMLKLSLDQALLEKNKDDIVVVNSSGMKMFDSKGNAREARTGWYIIDRKNGFWLECAEQDARANSIAWHQRVYLSEKAANVVNEKQGELVVLDIYDSYGGDSIYIISNVKHGVEARVAMESKPGEGLLRPTQA